MLIGRTSGRYAADETVETMVRNYLATKTNAEPEVEFNSYNQF